MRFMAYNIVNYISILKAERGGGGGTGERETNHVSRKNRFTIRQALVVKTKKRENKKAQNKLNLSKLIGSAR